MSARTATPRILPWLAGLVAAPPALAAVALAALRPEDAPWLLAASLCAAGTALVLCARRSARIVLAALPFALLAWPEMALRIAGFRNDHALTMQFGFPRPEMLVKLPPDEELFWRSPPDYPGANSLGFVGPEFRIPKPDGTVRFLFLGDSCAMQGYPGLVPEAMASRDGVEFDAINLGVGGYTTHQGVVLARRWAGKLQPDIVVVCYGWNDHWLAYGAPDSAKKQTAWQKTIQAATRSTRITQWVASRLPPDPPLSVTRVSESEYAANLERIGETAESAGARVLLMTAPTSADVLGPPAMMIPEFAESGQAILDRHRRYNEIVREVARRRSWRLLDLAVEVPKERLRELFLNDTVHFTKPGLVWIAQRIATELQKMLP
ncbi:MAG TPA: SGNH/GDSL hydrolase family protein [Planctomycetota bacterium]